LVLLALPFVLHGLIGPELNVVSSKIEGEGPYCLMILILLWILLMIFTQFLLPSWHGIKSFDNWLNPPYWQELVETLNSVFPYREGKESGWKIRMCHDVLHVAENICFFGWSQNTSGEWG
jgi:hypothetical protein